MQAEPLSHDYILSLPEEGETRITLRLLPREDGGLRIVSDDVPGLILSGADQSAVWRDLGPAIEALLKRNT